jgi:hypothetical protein
MKKFELLFLFVILVLGILLCSFLGGNCGKEGFEINTYTGVIVYHPRQQQHQACLI